MTVQPLRPGAQEPSAVGVCVACLRRTWLLRELSGHLEIAWKTRRPLRDVLALGDDALIAALGGGRTDELLRGWASFDAEPALEQVRRAGLEVVCRHAERFPGPLSDGAGAPVLLHVAGGLDQLDALCGTGVPVVAVVGSRRPSPEGAEIARALGRGLARAGVTVVSGMALGVDAAAHAGALEADGRTVAVLASGADVAYPPSKAALHREIARMGCVVSEMPPGTRPMRWGFPARNRTIAGLASLTVVVEAAQRSGSLITADFAQALGRDVAAVPGRATSPKARGSNELIRDGATVVLGVEDVLDAVLGFEVRRRGPAPATATAGLDPALATLLDAVASGRDSLAALAVTPAEADAALAGLAELEGLGLVTRVAGGRFLATAR